MARPWQARTSEFHPYMVDTVDALPASLAAPAKAALPPGVGVTRALYVPRDYRARGWMAARQTPEQALVFTDAGVLYVRGQPKGEEPGRGSGSEPTTGARTVHDMTKVGVRHGPHRTNVRFDLGPGGTLSVVFEERIARDLMPVTALEVTRGRRRGRDRPRSPPRSPPSEGRSVSPPV